MFLFSTHDIAKTFVPFKNRNTYSNSVIILEKVIQRLAITAPFPY